MHPACAAASCSSSNESPTQWVSLARLTVSFHFKEQHAARHQRESRPFAPAEGELFRAHDAEGGAIDGYIAEEPTALSVCGSNDELTYLPFKNNDTGFTATAADVGIAIGLKKGNALRDQINTVLAEITEEQKSQLMEQIVTLASGGTVTEFAVHCDAPATTTGTLKIGMECAYEPYNWTDTDGSSFGAVPISSEGQQGLYANGYDVQIAQYVANRLGLKLEIYAMEWDSLIPAVNSGAIDAIVAGMSPTAERAQEVDFTDTYYESNLVVIIRK